MIKAERIKNIQGYLEAIEVRIDKNKQIISETVESNSLLINLREKLTEELSGIREKK